MGSRSPIPDSLAAIRAGIGMVHQHFMLVEPFTVLENVVLGAEEGRLLRPSLARARAELKRLEEEYELDVDPDAVVGELSVGLQQRVEILKALYRECDILILDEPTGRADPGRGRPPVPDPPAPEGRGEDDRPDHPQAPGDHGGDRRGQRDAARRDGADLRDRRDQPGGARRGDGRAAGAAQGREGAGDAGRGAARGGRSLARRRQGGVAAEVGEPEPAGRRDPRGGGSGRERAVGAARGAGGDPAGDLRQGALQGRGPGARQHHQRRRPAGRRDRAHPGGPAPAGADHAVRRNGRARASATSTRNGSAGR